MDWSRRELLGGAGLGLAVLAVPSWAQAAGAAAGTPGRSLIVIQLAGGNDGLNTVVPLGQPEYAKLRPSVKLEAGEVLALDQGRGLHGSMGRLHDRFAAKQVAVIQGVGVTRANRSHFDMTAIWQTARLEPYRENAGWLGRAFESMGTAQRGAPPLSALGLGGGGLTPALYASRVHVTSLQSLDAFTVQPDRRYPADAPALNAGLAALYADVKGGGAPARIIRQVGRTALTSSDTLAQAVKKYDSRVEYPKGAFGDQLKLIAQLEAAGLGTRIYHLTLGGFDTHANQKKQQASLLGQLSEGVDALLADGRLHGFSERLCVLTYSEFGRRAQENASGGTDHGSGSVAFVVGEGVRGGLYGTPADLRNLSGGDVPVSVDFRRVYATVLEGWLGLKASPLLGGNFATLPLLA